MSESPWSRPPRYYHWYRFGPGELAFVAALWKRTATWTLPAAHSEVLRNEDEAAPVAVAHISVPERSTHLATFGVHMASPRICGDLISGDYAMYYLPDEPTDLAMEAIGAPGSSPKQPPRGSRPSCRSPSDDASGSTTARSTRSCTKFADTGQGLVGIPNKGLAPHEATDSLLPYNYGANRSWADVGELGRFVGPTRTEQVWGRPPT
ncbi:hypothetical protein ACFY00_27695 [Kitasatospora sp. NPDC001540]|uniref:hypothetical protein n=1 Tax=Kitasatospora sp. NPDC001540 TaxID=3364014 RepID=UPI0036882835